METNRQEKEVQYILELWYAYKSVTNSNILPMGIINLKIEGDVLVQKPKMIFGANISHSYDFEY